MNRINLNPKLARCNGCRLRAQTLPRAVWKVCPPEPPTRTIIPTACDHVQNAAPRFRPAARGFATRLGLLMALWLAAATAGVVAEPRVLLEDRFAGRLGEGWTWLRENPAAWRVITNGLEIRLEPGRAETVKNALRRKVPSRAGRRLAFEVTVIFTTPPTNQYEQAGLTWYADDKPVFKLVHELVDGRIVIIPGKLATDGGPVCLRLVVTNGKYTAQFRPAGEPEFRTVASGELPPATTEHISLQGYHGPAEAEHWVRFEQFRILEWPAE